MGEFIAYLNGEWVPRSELKVDVADRGFRVGDTVFDVTRTFNGKPFLLDRHVDRLYRSMKYTRIDIGMPAEEMTRVTLEAVEKNRGHLAEHGDFDIWHAITRGPGRWAYECENPTVIIDVGPVPWDWFGDAMEGAKGVITKTRSMSSETVDPKIKHHSRLNFNLAEMEAGDVESNGWPILTDASGNLTVRGDGRDHKNAGGYIHPSGDIPFVRFRPRTPTRYKNHRGGPPTLRPLHCRRSFLLFDPVLRFATHHCGQTADRGR